MKKMVVVLSALLMAAAAHAETKVGFVDMQKAIQSTSAGKKAKAELEGDFSKKKKELEKKEADLKKMGEDLEKKKSVLSEEALGKKQAEFQEEMLKYRDVVGKSQVEIQKKERDLTAPILEKMKKVIAKIAKEKGYSLIMENNQAILFATPESDLTDEVIKAYEKEK
ncbi:OmpH family outer membrane protein [Bdellovibrio svalbardensis]|uniref:OmpH family outer membrane protein n=1 Tax=Bdellovibrio svalbardensis TaxID=2972972 RepID=A0ABT6DLR8_9BACT|nr:OmpH family outer membrane protein [Bdellovibrio svalbardensis]MDG0817539.1 OmpH family outer membrane protein [Bdellovibrio svalbardensis]